MRQYKSLNDYLEKFNIRPNERRIIYNGEPLDYTVDTEGNVYSYKFINTDKPRRLIILYDEHDPPYCMVNLMLPNKKEKIFYVHSLVAKAFIPNDDPEHKTHVNHKSGIKTDNSIYNLEWATPKENMQHAVHNNLHPGRPGETHHAAQISNKEAKAIYDIAKLNRYNCNEIGNLFNVSRSVVSKIVHGYRWKNITGGIRLTCNPPKHNNDEIYYDEDVKNILKSLL